MDRSTRIEQHAKWLGVPEDVASRVARAVTEQGPVLLCVNGWMGSGKDTIAPLVIERFGLDVTGDTVVHSSFAHALKSEVGEKVMPILTAATSFTQARTQLREQLEVTDGAAIEVAGELWRYFTPGHELTAYSRTPEIRWLLQFWGTDVRRAQDPDFWVKQALAPVAEHIAEGRSVFITDARFPNEVTGAQGLGFHVVRLEISRETQRDRLMGRDGLTEDEYRDATSHASETALDDFALFDQRVDNDGGVERIEPVVTEIHQAMHSSRTAAAVA